MLVVRDIKKTAFSRGCVLCIGNFDGIHRGHQGIIKQVIKKSLANTIPCVVMTFEPHPQEVFSNHKTIRIMGLREKYAQLKQMHVDILYIQRFNQQFVKTTATDFIETYLINKLNVKHLIIGDDFCFGHGRKGNYSLLTQYADTGKFKLHKATTLLVDNDRVSSSRIRKSLNEGDLKNASCLLGHPYKIMGRVKHGNKLARKFGAPTANINLKKNRILMTGVFLVSVHGLEKTYHGVANLGFRPTVSGNKPILETNIFDFNQDCYGKLLEIQFIRKLRDEIHFENIKLLKNQINADIKYAKELSKCLNMH